MIDINEIDPEIIKGWRESLIRKSASRLVEQLENSNMTYDEAEGFTRSLIMAYEDMMEIKR